MNRKDGKPKEFKPRICESCGEEYIPTCTTQRYCGSKTNKTGCSWSMVAVRDKKRAKLPHRKKANLEAQKRWLKEQRKNNTDYAKRSREAKLKYCKTDHGKEVIRRGRKRNIKTILEVNRRRVIAKKGAIGSHTSKEWERLKEEYGNKCASCGTPEKELSGRWQGTWFVKLTRDHIVPISRGGSDNIGNIQPLCVSCNSSKHNKSDEPIACVSGGMDCLHVGHIDLIDNAARFGRVVVLLNSDEWIMNKKKYVLQTWERRAEVLLSLRSVTAVSRVDDSDGTVVTGLRKLKPTYFANGGDRDSANPIEHDICKELGIIELFGIGGGKKESSSLIFIRAVEQLKRNRGLTHKEAMKRVIADARGIVE